VTYHSELPDAGIKQHFEIDALLPAGNEKAALQGSPSSPSDANPFLTADHASVPEVVQASGPLDLTTAYQDIPGVTKTFTPALAETVWVLVVVSFRLALGTAACNAGDVLGAVLDVNGSDESLVLTHVAAGGVGSAQVVGFYVISADADTGYTLKIQARNATGARGRAEAVSQMTVWRMA